jgi:hypothetical protein
MARPPPDADTLDRWRLVLEDALRPSAGLDEREEMRSVIEELRGAWRDALAREMTDWRAVAEEFLERHEPCSCAEDHVQKLAEMLATAALGRPK